MANVFSNASFAVLSVMETLIVIILIIIMVRLSLSKENLNLIMEK